MEMWCESFHKKLLKGILLLSFLTVNFNPIMKAQIFVDSSNKFNGFLCLNNAKTSFSFDKKDIVGESTFLSSNQNNQTVGDTNLLEFEETVGEIPLLPSNISFMEKFLWGEKGLFRKIGITSELTPNQREKELTWRRTMLTIHQTSGLISWGLMLGTVLAGQFWLDGKLDSPDLHKKFLYSTIGLYGLTGLISVITPPPLQRNKEFSTITFHKTVAWLHFLGMVATPIIGKMINSSSDYYKTARIHQTFGYVTFSAYTIAMLSILLFR